jgi:uncharacterized protein (UPF0147 family)
MAKVKDIHKRLEQLVDEPAYEWPRSAAEWVRGGLAHEDAKTRRLAVSLAHEIVDDELAAELLRLCREDEAEIAAEAAIALGPALEECSIDYDDEGLPPELDFHDQPLTRDMFAKVCAALEGVYRDGDRPPLVRRRALEAAVRAPRDWQNDVVRAAYASDDVRWRETAVFCMGLLPGFDAQILEALSADAEGVRCEALRAAGLRELVAASAEVMRVAADASAPKPLRVAAIDSLSALDPDGSEELLEKLAEDGDEDLAAAAETALEERSVFASMDKDAPDDDN